MNISKLDTRTSLAYYWSLVASGMLFYTLVRFGDKVEILTLLIGLVGGTIIGGIFGTYFSSTNTTKTHPAPGTVTDINVQATTTVPLDEVPKPIEPAGE